MSIMAGTHGVSPRAVEGNQVHHAKRFLLIFGPFCLFLQEGGDPKTGSGILFSREAQKHLLYCSAQVYIGAKHIQPFGPAHSRDAGPQGFDTTIPDGEGTI